MKRAKAKFILPVLLILAGACTHTYKERLDEGLKPWIGEHPDRLVEKWGAPSSTYVMENGAKVLSFEENAMISRTYNTGRLWRPDTYSYSESCKLSFVTDSTQKKVERYSYTGHAGTCLELLSAIPAAK